MMRALHHADNVAKISYQPIRPRQNISVSPAQGSQATTGPITVSGSSPKRRRLIWVGAAYRLAVVTLRHPFAYVASSLGCELSPSCEHTLNAKMPRETPRQRDSSSRMKRYKHFNREPQTTFQDLEPVLPKLLQEVLFEIAPRAEKSQIGIALFMMLVFEGGVLDAARKIGDLSEPVEARSRFTVYQGLPPQSVFECPMQGVRNQALPVVVVNLHSIELLESLQVLKEELDDVALHFLPKRRSICELAFPIHKRLVAEGYAPSKRGEAEQIARPHLDILVGKGFVAVRQRHEMERLVLQSAFAKQALITGYIPRYVNRLFVKHERQDVVLGVPAQIAGLIYKNGKLTHRKSPRGQESRGDPPALDGSPCVETYLIYITRRFDYSIIAKYEHMFSIVDTNTCSTYRKAA